MVETVNIPSLAHAAMWRRGSETAAQERKSALKAVGAEEGRQIHPPSRVRQYGGPFGDC